MQHANKVIVEPGHNIAPRVSVWRVRVEDGVELTEG